MLVLKRNELTGALDSSCICIKRWPSQLSLEREAHWSCKLLCPSTYEHWIARAKKWEWVGRGVAGEGMGDFWDSIGNVNEENT